MKEKNKVILTGVLFICLILIGVGIYFFLSRSRDVEKTPVIETEKKAPEPSLGEKERIKEEDVDVIEVKLDESDPVIRKLVKDFSSYEEFDKWIESKNLIPKFTAAVDNIAHGISSRYQIDFFAPEEDFEVITKGEKIYISPDSYNRYDIVADVFSSLDADKCVHLYKRAKPLIQEAYKELGYPEKDFEKTLLKAIALLLEVPVLEKDIELEKKVVSYKLKNEDLENLSDPQKHLLRMGPENIKKIQSKLREIGKLLQKSRFE
ncbi:MAG: DUF3014 domain-containing protein [Candidatus Aminicenantaceae bacterium]